MKIVAITYFLCKIKFYLSEDGKFFIDKDIINPVDVFISTIELSMLADRIGMVRYIKSEDGKQWICKRSIKRNKKLFASVFGYGKTKKEARENSIDIINKLENCMNDQGKRSMRKYLSYN